ncbi:MAG: DNA repair protein RadA [Candidatus Saccharibacteria bacterium]
MAKKQLSKYVCNSCGAVYASWSGKCAQCNNWNTIEEVIQIEGINKIVASGKKLDSDVMDNLISKDVKRLTSSIPEIDEVLGGGLVIGSVNLIAGQPGVGKSTILLQYAYSLAENNKVLYVSGEESSHQIGLRAKRLGVNQTLLRLSTSNSADDIAATIVEDDFDIVIVDSIQTITTGALSSSGGSVSQITGCTQLLTNAAKRTSTALILVGHVTKEGNIAGPKVLEHLVDVVLQLEGERYGSFKILRTTKNRFGSTTEIGIFEMKETGLVSVDNPSAAMLEERQNSDGSVVFAALEGTRPILVEIQALVNKTSYGYPKRTASGFDLNRLNLLIAVLEKRTKLKLADQDIYINIVGGLKINEPAADLAICMAIGSAAKGLKLKNNSVVAGEVGLSGEIRSVPYLDKRLAETKKLGFDSIICSKQNNISDKMINSVSSVKDALNQFLKTTG